MTEQVLVTGGSGMIGSRLTDLLGKEGFEVGILSRKNEPSSLKSWHWDIKKREIDSDAILNADHIVHLVGAGLSEKKWSDVRKKEILESRTKSTELLFKVLSESKHHVKSFISASAIGYYGWNTGSILVDEDRNKPGDDFLAVVVKEWESAANKINSLKIRTVILRFGLVLSNKGGVLQKMILPARFGLGAAFGSGDQYMSWIHIDDLCRLIIMTIKNESLHGVFNAVSPEPVTNKEFTRSLLRRLGKISLIPNIPSFILRLILGEMASMVIGGNRVSSKKIELIGFNFQHRNINDAFKNLIVN